MSEEQEEAHSQWIIKPPMERKEIDDQQHLFPLGEEGHLFEGGFCRCEPKLSLVPKGPVFIHQKFDVSHDEQIESILKEIEV